MLFNAGLSNDLRLSTFPSSELASQTKRRASLSECRPGKRVSALLGWILARGETMFTRAN
jgi:hypothetical protein